MYTLKIHWTRHVGEAPGKPVAQADETTLFLPADEVQVHGMVLGTTWQETMSKWDEDQYHQYLCDCHFDTDSDPVFQDGRLIRLRHNGTWAWYLASHAWLLGANGKTIERLC